MMQQKYYTTESHQNWGSRERKVAIFTPLKKWAPITTQVADEDGKKLFAVEISSQTGDLSYAYCFLSFGWAFMTLQYRHGIF